MTNSLARMDYRNRSADHSRNLMNTPIHLLRDTTIHPAQLIPCDVKPSKLRLLANTEHGE